MIMILKIVVCLAVLIAQISGAHAAGRLDQTFRGKDDRVILDTIEAPYAAIGRLNLGGGRQFCTGILVAPDRVITAAHCLTDRRTKRPYLPSRIHFVAGQRRNTHLDHAAAKCVRYLRGRKPDGTARINGFNDDAAVVVLSRNLKVAPAPLAEPYFAKLGPLDHSAYSRNRPFLLSQHAGCKLLKKAKGVWLTDCDTNFGSSGGPVFIQSAGRLELAAIMSGVEKREDGIVSVANPITLWGKLVRQASCSSH